TCQRAARGIADQDQHWSDLRARAPSTRAVSDASRAVGRRVLIDGMMGSGKSTFARALATRTDLPLIHLDLYYWKPGWVAPSDDEWCERQRTLLAGEAWIIDGNYNETLPLRLERADTVIFLDTPWWLCASRAFMRGLRKPGGGRPQGVEDSPPPPFPAQFARPPQNLPYSP